MDNGSGDKPLSKQDLNEALQKFGMQMTEQMKELGAELKSYVDERSERIETKLLTAFHSWAHDGNPSSQQ